MTCRYCDQIVAADPAYAPHPAEFDLGSEAPRCRWHWRMICDHCRQVAHFAAHFYCPRTGRLLCRNAGEVTVEEVNAAIRRHLDPAKLSVYLAGDFAKAAQAQAGK